MTSQDVVDIVMSFGQPRKRATAGRSTPRISAREELRAIEEAERREAIRGAEAHHLADAIRAGDVVESDHV